MKRKLMISETHVMQMILQEFNDNYNGVNFLYSNWTHYNQENNDYNGNLLIQRIAIGDGRFDVKEVYNELTYATNSLEFTPINFGSLNAEYLTIPTIHEANFSPTISILVCADRDEVLFANTIALQELRARFMQYTKEVVIENMDLNSEEGNYVAETYKAVFIAGEIDFGTTEVINGRRYIQMSMPLNIFVTNKGELSNQQQFFFGVSSITENGKPKMFEFPLLSWHWGMVLDTTDTQIINGGLNKTINSINRSKEVKSIPKSKGFALTFYVPLNFDNEFHAHLYDESIEPKNEVFKYYIEFRTHKYNNETKQMELWKTNKRTYLLNSISPPEEVSLGDELNFVLSFTPSWETEWFE